MTDFDKEARRLRAENILERSRNHPKDSLQSWLIRAARTVGVGATTGIALSSPEEFQEAMDELFLSMPTELSLVAAMSLMDAIKRETGEDPLAP